MNATMTKTKSLLVAMCLVAAGIFSTSCGNGENGANLQVPGVKGPTLTLVEDQLLISAVFENLQLEGGLRYAIPEYPGSYIEIGPDLESNGTLMSVQVSLKDLLDTNLHQLDPKALPGGRALPGVPSGRLPAVAFTIEAFENMSFYLGPKFFGVFFPTKVDIGMNNIITARYYGGKVRAGTLSMVGPDENDENSGFLLLIDMQSKVAEKIKKRVRRKM